MDNGSVTGTCTGNQSRRRQDAEPTGVERSSERSVLIGGDEAGKQRLTWDSKFQYIFMLISFAVSFGTFWRFPYLTQKHGGGAFLIPYLVMMCVEGVPMLYLELAIGQHIRKSCVEVWDEIHPMLGGLGLSAVITSLSVGVLLNTLVMWIYFYLFHSFQSPLPWSNCPSYTTEANVTEPEPECELSSPASYFWYRKALNISPGVEESGGFPLEMLGCLFLAWSLLCLCVSKGVRSSGKVSFALSQFSARCKRGMDADISIGLTTDSDTLALT
ncbi:transporter [Plakobranchus ocellatus]|uniref:Transporter n=1 Tax=Plakobranchus ocellatus TaxID=259542 RepID=A0AAV4DJ07_9GAST|nr:transporter [Plakobranchus ocellatus]